jgi:thiol-disulfide isomerase/thioredoxin
MPRWLRWTPWIGLPLLAGVVVALIVSQRSPAPPPTGGPSPATLPRFELPDLAGHLHSVDEWRGKLLVLNFWATWCAPCRREMPLLDVLNRESASDLRVVGVAIDHAEPVQSFVSESGVRYMVLVGQDEAMQIVERIAPDFEGLPLTIVVAPDGRIIQIHMGELHPEHLRAIATAAAAMGQHALSATEAERRLRAAFKPS